MIPALLLKLLGPGWYAWCAQRVPYALTALWTGLLGFAVPYFQANHDWAKLDWHKVAQDAAIFIGVGLYNHRKQPPVTNGKDAHGD